MVDYRADRLAAGDILVDASLDPYTFLRDAYLQRRQNLVYDGNPPESEEGGDVWNDVDFQNQGTVKPAKPKSPQSNKGTQEHFGH
jgi:phospholipid-binding lipoprotein MlaA